ncbi:MULTISPECIES: exodeoxyribonuclease VII small subunit [unclassified Sporolactobacillus]|uniref:exodeoxyribonuclease VII small subunit n=1 Tax=unclassified Sporolactobacillus TaxID=2628533 RepID=UPI0023684F60|nr:exodeoxyribonuclease VII small subunit [Sporolactobacillus sp. CQH2019]MDD9149304.1 exodeoxyribonuclease VII small subunit [Sporolactobacillus sp. CQH2019]
MSEASESDQNAVPTFEEAMEKLETIVRQLEESDVPLEKAIDLFQEGMSLSKLCHEKLETVGKKMDQLIDSNGEARPFSVQGDDKE